MERENESRLTFMQIHFFYEMYLENFYRQNPALLASDFNNKVQGLIDDAFSGIHIIAPYMSELQYDTFFSVANDPVSQGAWLNESGGKIATNDWVREIARLQVEAVRPDVLYLSEPITLDSSFIRSLSYKPRLVIGWRAANIPAETDWSEFDIILSSLSALREAALGLGARSVEHFWPGFPVRFYEEIKDIKPEYDLMFCGQWTTAQHQRRNELLESIANHSRQARPNYTPAFYLSGQTALLPESVRQYQLGERYGLSMFKAIRAARAVFDARGSIAVQGDQSVDVAKKETANMRIFEATGCGRLLFTEEYQNIRELFQPGKEIITYRSEKDLIDKIRFYTQNRELANEIALAGMHRCHSEHSMSNRVRRMDAIIRERLHKQDVGKSVIQIQEHDMESVSLEAQRQKAFELLDGEQLEEAFDILTQVKSRKTALVDIDFARAVYFIKKNSLGDARQCLLEELRHFPENKRAKDILTQVEDALGLEKRMSQYEPEFRELMLQIDPYTMLPIERLYSLYALSKRVCEEDIPGNFVECGVAGGGSTALLAHMIRKYSKRPRKLFACDSYDGMPEPSEHDTLQGQQANDTGWGVGTCAAPEESVKEISKKFGVLNLVEIVKGYFEDSLPPRRAEIGDIALIHIDCDWYESTKTVLKELYHQFHPGGVCQIDDYGYWEGMKKAFDEFQVEQKISLDIQTIDGMSAWFTVPQRNVKKIQLIDTDASEGEMRDPVQIALQLLNTQNDDDVIRLFADSMSQAPVELKIVLSLAYARKGEKGKAKKILQDALIGFEDHALGQNVLMELARDTNFPTQASPEGEKDGISVERKLDLALECLREERSEQAKTILEEVSEGGKQVRDLRYIQALYYIQVGEHERGIEMLEAELQLHPNNQNAKTLLEQIR